MFWQVVEEEYRPTGQVVVSCSLGIRCIPSWRWLWAILDVSHWKRLDSPDDKQNCGIHSSYHDKFGMSGIRPISLEVVNAAEALRFYMEDHHYYKIASMRLDNV